MRVGSTGPEIRHAAAWTAAITMIFPVLLSGAFRESAPVVFDVGPNTGRWGAGFEESEERPPLTQRWTRDIAHVALPLRVQGEARLEIRSARYVDSAARIRIRQAGRDLVDFVKTPGGQRIDAWFVDLEGLLELSILSSDSQSDSRSGSKLGLAIDWIRVTGARVSIPWSEWPIFLVPGGLALGGWLAGASRRMGLGLGAVSTLVFATFFARDPFGFVHAMRDLALPTIAVSLVSGAALGQLGFSPWTHAALLATFLLKGSFLFHPSYFYNDVRQNDRYVRALATLPGGLLERGVQAQKDLNVGYPRIIGGKKYAFPYSPLFYWPFTFLPSDRDLVVRAIKHVALAAAVLEIALIATIARAAAAGLGGAPAAALLEALAAWLTFAFPVLTNRMLFAMWSTLAGHALDLTVIVTAIWWLKRPDDRRRALVFGVSILVAFATYVSSLFNVTAFALALALVLAKAAPRFARSIVFVWCVVALVVVFGLYGAFTRTFVAEIAPDLLRGDGAAADRNVDSSLVANLISGFDRVVLFGGFGFACFAGCGAFLLWRDKSSEPGPRVVRGYAIAFLSLVLLRGLSFGLFKDLKEVEFAAPLLCLLAALSLLRLGAWSKPALALVVAGLIGFGVLEQRAAFGRWSGLVQGGRRGAAAAQSEAITSSPTPKAPGRTTDP